MHHSQHFCHFLSAVVLCEGVQHHLLFYLDNLNGFQNGGLSALSSIRKQRKVRWVEEDSHVAFGKKIPW
jgi:hypothetical protein